MTEHVHHLDLSGSTSARNAARALHKYLVEVHDADAQLYSPSDNPQGTNAWAVNWESGPYQWAIALTAGCSLYSWETYFRYDLEPEVTGFDATADWFAEPYFSFDLQFYDLQS